MLVKGIANLVRVTDRDIMNFDYLYHMVVLTTEHEVINSFPSPSRVSFRLNKAIMMIRYLSGFHLLLITQLVDYCKSCILIRYASSGLIVIVIE